MRQKLVKSRVSAYHRVRPMTTSKKPSFQEIILRLQQYWSDKGCALLQPYDMEVGAGTFHPATTLRARRYCSTRAPSTSVKVGMQRTSRAAKRWGSGLRAAA